ncbi:hypothetical protein F5Y06DRAFT_85721 [Hypoxylon sp. FL0890]|nr:hypothetical protein F5Y06DRAFT_85721 [Hypoxylon sp. FL0890]
MKQRAFKKLAPAPAEPSSSESHSQVPLSVPGPRRNLTRNACSQCKVKKAKCDGNRPSCGRCQRTGDTCIYEVNKRDIAKLQVLSDYEIARLHSYDQVWTVLQNGTDEQATEILGQIRTGVSVETLASTFNPSSTKPSNSASSNQPTFITDSGSAATQDDSETHSTTETPQSFMDLLYDREDWYQPIDGADGAADVDATDGADGTSFHSIQDE